MGMRWSVIIRVDLNLDSTLVNNFTHCAPTTPSQSEWVDPIYWVGYILVRIKSSL
jgi:hypothetical protein